MKYVLADVLAAHAVQNKDLRLSRLVEQFRNSDILRESEGGTTQIPQSYFHARGDFFADLLWKIYSSRVFETFCKRSVFFQKEDRQIAKLEKIRGMIEEMAHRKYGLRKTQCVTKSYLYLGLCELPRSL